MYCKICNASLKDRRSKYCKACASRANGEKAKARIRSRQMIAECWIDDNGKAIGYWVVQFCDHIGAPPTGYAPTAPGSVWNGW